jgi:hypothetical protein
MIEPFVSAECRSDGCGSCQDGGCTCGCHHIGDEEAA